MGVGCTIMGPIGPTPISSHITPYGPTKPPHMSPCIPNESTWKCWRYNHLWNFTYEPPLANAVWRNRTYVQKIITTKFTNRTLLNIKTQHNVKYKPVNLHLCKTSSDKTPTHLTPTSPTIHWHATWLETPTPLEMDTRTPRLAPQWVPKGPNAP